MSRLITATVAIAVLLGGVGEHLTPVRHNETLDLAVSVKHIAVIGDSYTTGGDLGGLGAKGWTARAWQLLTQQGTPVAPDVAAEGGAGYGTRGSHGSVFEDLTADAVKPDDVLVVFFGSRNDQGVDPTQLSILAWARINSRGALRRRHGSSSSGRRGPPPIRQIPCCGSATP